MEPLIKHMELPLSQFSPTLISSYLFSPDMAQLRGRKLDNRLVMHYEFEFILESHGGMMVDDMEYDLKPNDIVFRRPGQTTQGILPYKCYAIIFDIVYDTGKAAAYDRNDGIHRNWYEEINTGEIVSYVNPVLDSIPLIFNTKYPEKYIPLFNFIMKEHINPSFTSDVVFKINILQILNVLYYEVTNALELDSMPMTGQYTYIRKALEFIKANWNTEISLDTLSNNSGLSRNHFLKVFTKAMNLTPKDYITKIRMERAKQMLAMTSAPINVISINCGYDNIPYFSYLFKKKIGIAPNEFRKRYSYY